MTDSQSADTTAEPEKKGMQDITLKMDDGTAYQLRFSLKALYALQDLWDCHDDAKIFARLAKPNMRDVVDFIWASSQSHHPDLEKSTLIDKFDEEGFTGLQKVAKDLMASANAPNKDGKPKKT